MVQDHPKSPTSVWLVGHRQVSAPPNHAALHRDGASRSGIFCAASFLCEQIQSEGLVDVSQAVRMLKRRRRQLIKDVVGVDFTLIWELEQYWSTGEKLLGAQVPALHPLHQQL